MTVVRLLQGWFFGYVLSLNQNRSGSSSPRFVLGSILVLLALLLYMKALRTALGAEDEDAPPPAWLVKAGSMSPLAAFGAGAGFMTISVKFFVFTLGAISAIAEAHLRPATSALAFLLFVLLAEAAPLMILACSISSSRQSTAILDGLNAWLQRNNRTITIVFGLVFGTWFLLKAFRHLHIL